MTTLQWDRTNLCPAKVSIPKYMANNTSGGVGFGGTEQIIGNTPGRWGMKFSDIAINTPTKILVWNATAVLLEGRLNPILIPLFDRNRAPDPPVTATMVGDTAPGTVACSIEVSGAGGALVAGNHFSVAERLYRIQSITGTDPVGGNITYGVTIRPPVREMISDGTALEFNDPWFRVRLATDDEMSDVDLDAFKFGSGVINFLEDA